tara:strand:+ start:1306 stop:1557 length:252 start_codon:yes stop_codon:yes gene_type:complete
VNDTKYNKGDLVSVVPWAEESFKVEDQPKYISKVSHPLAGKKAIFLLTKDCVYAIVLGENGVIDVEEAFLRLTVPATPHTSKK